MSSNKIKESKVIYHLENVGVILQDQLKEELAFPGTLIIIHESHGLVVEWHPLQENSYSLQSSPVTEHHDCDDFTVVGYKTKQEESDTVEIKSSRIPKAIVFDVLDLSSFRSLEQEEGSKKNKVTFSLKDGSSIPSFSFQDDEIFQEFLIVLKQHITIKRSSKDPSLFLINDPDGQALKKSFSELDLFDVKKPTAIIPYRIVGQFAKVTGFISDILMNSNGTNLPPEYKHEEVVELLNQSLPRIHSCYLESGYELITCVNMPPRKDVTREDPVTSEEWNSYIDTDGRFQNLDRLKNRIFKGGLMHSARSEAWKYLCGFFSFEETYKEREKKRKHKEDDYYRMKLQWKSMSSDQESRFSALRERRNLIEKDVSRTDRVHPFFEGDDNMNIQMLYDILMTYCMYNFDLGYVQGMSDLLSPILVVMQNEADSFWCFANWMEKVGDNFELDQLGMMAQLQNLNCLLHFVDSQFTAYLENHESANLYFVFRWVLILFKRDFKFQEVMRIWEILWTGLPCKNFHLLICLAILDTEKVTIMENNYGLTEILKHINDMAYKINLEETLCKAEAIYHQILGCSEITNAVQNILGLEVSKEEKPPLPAAVKTNVTPEDDDEVVTLSDSEKSKKEVSRESTPINGYNEDYVQVDSLFDYSFGLLT